MGISKQGSIVLFINPSLQQDNAEPGIDKVISCTTICPKCAKAAVCKGSGTSCVSKTISEINRVEGSLSPVVDFLNLHTPSLYRASKRRENVENGVPQYGNFLLLQEPSIVRYLDELHSNCVER